MKYPSYACVFFILILSQTHGVNAINTKEISLDEKEGATLKLTLEKWGVKKEVPVQEFEKIVSAMVEALEATIKNLDALYASYPEKTPLSHRQIKDLAKKANKIYDQLSKATAMYRDTLTTIGQWKTGADEMPFLRYLWFSTPGISGWDPLSKKISKKIRMAPRCIEKIMSNDRNIRQFYVSALKVFKALSVYLNCAKKGHDDTALHALKQSAQEELKVTLCN